MNSANLEKNLQPGDAVCLKHEKDLPKKTLMTVEGYNDSLLVYSCVWMNDKSQLQRDFFPEAVLEKIQTSPDEKN